MACFGEVFTFAYHRTTRLWRKLGVDLSGLVSTRTSFLRQVSDDREPSVLDRDVAIFRRRKSSEARTAPILLTCLLQKGRRIASCNPTSDPLMILALSSVHVVAPGSRLLGQCSSEGSPGGLQ